MFLSEQFLPGGPEPSPQETETRPAGRMDGEGVADAHGVVVTAASPRAGSTGPWMEGEGPGLRVDVPALLSLVTQFPRLGGVPCRALQCAVTVLCQPCRAGAAPQQVSQPLRGFPVGSECSLPEAMVLARGRPGALRKGEGGRRAPAWRPARRHLSAAPGGGGPGTCGLEWS